MKIFTTSKITFFLLLLLYLVSCAEDDLVVIQEVD